jgi:hypothetical protein
MAQLPGTILSARFVLPGNKLFSGFIDYMDRDEAVRNQYQAQWNLFTAQNEAQGSTASETMTSKQIEMTHDKVVPDYEGFNDYMGDKRKNGGLFTATKDTLTNDNISQVKRYYREAQRAGSPLWQLVFSFDNAWLKEEGLLDPDTGYLDTSKIQTATRNAVQTLERQTGLQGLWTASLHYNTDNLHVHIGYVERQPTRKWIYYKSTKRPELLGW